jgi:hypothetical protein
MKKYRIWLEVEEYDTETDEYSPREDLNDTLPVFSGPTLINVWMTSYIASMMGEKCQQVFDSWKSAYESCPLYTPEGCQNQKRSTDTDPDYWDCDCLTDYIHKKTQMLSCRACGAKEDEHPDSIREEVKNQEKTKDEAVEKYKRRLFDKLHPQEGRNTRS